MLGVHFFTVILPLAKNGFAGTEPQNLLPWGATLIGLYIWRQRHLLAAEKYTEFLKNSPGKVVETTGIEYGVGHPPHQE